MRNKIMGDIEIECIIVEIIWRQLKVKPLVQSIHSIPLMVPDKM